MSGAWIVPIGEETDVAMAHRAVPLLLRICAAIDDLFIDEVGPQGAKLVEGARKVWLATGNRSRPADAQEYVYLLAQYIRDPGQRADFVEEAKHCIRL
jgi:hypothetical protein